MKRFTLLTITIALLFVAGCQTTTSPATENNTTAPPANETFCIEVYQPVCAEAPNGTIQTYTNACFADQADAEVLYEAECGTQTQPPQVCTMEYDPVCAQLSNGTTKTFGNDCMARAATATVISDGECPERNNTAAQ